jgi:hypothetical protein
MKKIWFISLWLISCEKVPSSDSLVGTWNSFPADNIALLEIRADKAVFEFGCGSAEIMSAIEIDDLKAREYNGVYQRGRPVIPVDYDPKTDQVNAIFTFKRKGEILNVSINEALSKTEISKFEFKRGSNKNIIKCL